MSSSGISPSFLGLSRSSGWVTHVLLTRSRLCHGPKPASSLHLHVLSTPPAFVLSQDQTLREELHKERHASLEGHPVHMRVAGHLTGLLLLLSTTGTTMHRRPKLSRRMRIPCAGHRWVAMPASRNLDTFRWQGSHQKCMLLSFQRPRVASWRGFLRFGSGSLAALPGGSGV